MMAKQTVFSLFNADPLQAREESPCHAFHVPTSLLHNDWRKG